MSTVPIPPNDIGMKGWMWPVGQCPKCGSLYFEWLSYKEEPDSIYLNCELKERAREFYPGRMIKRALDSSESSISFDAAGGTYTVVFDT